MKSKSNVFPLNVTSEWIPGGQSQVNMYYEASSQLIKDVIRRSTLVAFIQLICTYHEYFQALCVYRFKLSISYMHTFCQRAYKFIWAQFFHPTTTTISLKTQKARIKVFCAIGQRTFGSRAVYFTIKATIWEGHVCIKEPPVDFNPYVLLSCYVRCHKKRHLHSSALAWRRNGRCA